MPTILYLTAHFNAKRARLTRSSFIAYRISLGLSGGCKHLMYSISAQPGPRDTTMLRWCTFLFCEFITIESHTLNHLQTKQNISFHNLTKSQLKCLPNWLKCLLSRLKCTQEQESQNILHKLSVSVTN